MDNKDPRKTDKFCNVAYAVVICLTILTIMIMLLINDDYSIRLHFDPFITITTGLACMFTAIVIVAIIKYTNRIKIETNILALQKIHKRLLIISIIYWLLFILGILLVAVISIGLSGITLSHYPEEKHFQIMISGVFEFLAFTCPAHLVMLVVAILTTKTKNNAKRKLKQILAQHKSQIASSKSPEIDESPKTPNESPNDSL